MSELGVLRLPSSSQFAWRVDFSPDGKMLASGGEQEESSIPFSSFNIGVRIWDTESLQEIKYRTGFDTSDVKFSPRGHLLACTKNAQVYLWNVQNEEVSILDGHGSIIRRIAFSPDGTKIASACADGTVQLWDVKTKKSITFQTHDNSIQCWAGYGAFSITFSPNEELIASGGSDDHIRFWDPYTGSQKKLFVRTLLPDRNIRYRF